MRLGRLPRRRRSAAIDPARRTPGPSAAPRVAPAEPVEAADVVVRMFGPFEVTIHGTRIDRWPSARGAAILKYLLLHRDRTARRETLMDLFWPDHRQQSARNNLNVAIYALRRSLDQAADGASLVCYSDGGYLLHPDMRWWVDMAAFDEAIAGGDAAAGGAESRGALSHYLRAVALYRGPLFEDDAASEWFLEERRYLQERYLTARERVACLLLDAGEVTEAVSNGQDVLRTDPCRETTHRLLMRCFALQQQRQLVARQFARCAEVLETELGLPPGEETRRLYGELTGAPARA